MFSRGSLGAIRELELFLGEPTIFQPGACNKVLRNPLPADTTPETSSETAYFIRVNPETNDVEYSFS